MGKGDRRSLKGKRWRHSYGVSRKRKDGTGIAFVPKTKKEQKAAAAENAEVTETAAAKKATGAKKAPAKKKAPAAKKSSKKKEE